MDYMWLIASVLIWAYTTVADDSCPTPQELAPCTCDGEGLNCMGKVNIDIIRKAFRANFKYNGVRSVWIQGTPITSIPSDLFSNIKSQQFFIEVNNITSVDIQAFKASHNTLRLLSFFGNKITSFDFKALTPFRSLGTLNLGRNRITSVPDNAFDHQYLYTIILTQNRITTIGKNAFTKLPNLAALALSMNSISVLGPYSMALGSKSNSLQVNLAANQISTVDETAFKDSHPHVVFLTANRLTHLPYAAFKDLVISIAQRGGYLEISQNPFTCKGCDYKWLITNQNLLQGRVAGLTCPDGKGLGDLRREDIDCP